MNSSKNYLLDCLAREILAMPKGKQAEFGKKLKKHHTQEFIDDLKKRMRAMK